MKKHNINLGLIMIAFFLVAACSWEPGIDKNKFTKLNVLAHALKTARIGGATYRQLSEQAGNLSAEVIALRNKVTTKEEKELLDAYSDLSAIYHDGLLLWKYQLEFAPFDFVPTGRIYVGQDVEPIVSKYHFATESHQYRPTGQKWKSLPEDSIKIVWNNADAQLKIIENMTNYR